MRTRTLARSYALQILYQIDITNERIDRVLDKFWQSIEYFGDKHVSDTDYSTAQKLATQFVNGTLEHLAAIDKAIADCAIDWEIPRMPVVDRCILRLAAYELLYVIDIPPAVTINEAIELAKKFSTDESPKYINAVLDKVKDLKGQTPIEYLRQLTG